jgi:hypothetical protein
VFITFGSALVLTGQQIDQDGKFRELLEATDILTVNQKAELVKKLLNSSGWMFADSSSGSLIRQINSASRETLADAMAAIARRIATDGEAE